jgi:hypothetical protein
MGEDGEPVNTGRKLDGRFKPGHKPMGGRPKGARARATLATEKLLTGADDLKAISKVVLERARAGEPWAAKLVIERVLPVARDRPLMVDLPPITGPADIAPALCALVAMVASGEVTPAEGASLSAMIEGLGKAFETVDLTREVADLRELVETLQQQTER